MIQKIVETVCVMKNVEYILMNPKLKYNLLDKKDENESNNKILGVQYC